MPEPEKQTGRTAKNSKFYNSRHWRKHAKAFLNKNPLCVHCAEDGKVVAAKVVDHIKRIEAGGDKWSYSNLQGLCEHHHAVKSGKERHENKNG